MSELWRDRVLDLTLGTSANDLTVTVRDLMSFLIQGHASDVNLSGFNAHEVNCMHLAVVLRMTAINRGVVAGWDHALSVAESACLLNGLDPKIILHGLLG